MLTALSTVPLALSLQAWAALDSSIAEAKPLLADFARTTLVDAALKWQTNPTQQKRKATVPPSPIKKIAVSSSEQPSDNHNEALELLLNNVGVEQV